MTDWQSREFRRLYVEQASGWLLLPFAVRATAYGVIANMPASGRLSCGRLGPADALATLCRVHADELEAFRGHVAALLEDGFLLDDGEAVLVRNWAEAQGWTKEEPTQDQHSSLASRPMTAAERAAKYRASKTAKAVTETVTARHEDRHGDRHETSRSASRKPSRSVTETVTLRHAGRDAARDAASPSRALSDLQSREEILESLRDSRTKAAAALSDLEQNARHETSRNSSRSVTETVTPAVTEASRQPSRSVTEHRDESGGGGGSESPQGQTENQTPPQLAPFAAALARHASLDATARAAIVAGVTPHWETAGWLVPWLVEQVPGAVGAAAAKQVGPDKIAAFVCAYLRREWANRHNGQGRAPAPTAHAAPAWRPAAEVLAEQAAELEERLRNPPPPRFAQRGQLAPVRVEGQAFPDLTGPGFVPTTRHQAAKEASK